MAESNLIRGPVKKCLAHYFAAEWNGNSRYALSELAGCAQKSVNEWARGAMMPKGQNLLRVSHYLAIVGYEVLEIEKLDPDIRSLGTAVMLSICTIDDIVAALEYGGETTPENRRSDLYRILIYGGGMTPERAKKATAFLETRRAQLEQTLAGFKARVPKPGPPGASLQQPEPSPARVAERQIAPAPSGVAPRPPRVRSKSRTQTRVAESRSRNGNEAATMETVQVSAALVQSLYRNVRLLKEGKLELREAFRKRAPDMRDLAHLLLVIDSHTE